MRMKLAENILLLLVAGAENKWPLLAEKSELADEPSRPWAGAGDGDGNRLWKEICGSAKTQYESDTLRPILSPVLIDVLAHGCPHDVIA